MRESLLVQVVADAGVRYLARDQPGFLQDPQVLGYRRLGQLEGADYISANASLVLGQQAQDSNPGGVCQCPRKGCDFCLQLRVDVAQ